MNVESGKLASEEEHHRVIDHVKGDGRHQASALFEHGNPGQRRMVYGKESGPLREMKANRRSKVAL